MIYAVIAVLIAGMLNYFVLVGSKAVEGRQYQNEILTQVSGVAHEVLDQIGARPFDARTDTLLYPDPPSGPQELTAESYFGGECDPYLNCLDIDDFHGKTMVIQRGTSYSVTVDVKYVDELDPTMLAGTQTFAKLVTLTIENTYIRDPVEDKPWAINISRVYTYLRTTI